MKAYSAYSLPSTFQESSTAESRVYRAAPTTCSAAPVPLAVVDVQHDLVVSVEALPLARPLTVDLEAPPSEHRG